VLTAENIRSNKGIAVRFSRAVDAHGDAPQSQQQKQ
jgi:hypothetical protein